MRGQLQLPPIDVLLAPLPPEELATNVRLGKLTGAERLLRDLPSLLQHLGFQPLAVQLHHGVHAGGYRQAHRN